MCGIAGGWKWTGRIAAEEIGALSHEIRHRGPDGAGSWRDETQGLALIHRRLAIVDTSSNGHQPMSWASERYWLTFNGEIYNFLELRRELESEGARFRSEGDTEVVLAAYEKWGDACWNKFNGMWALALYDTREKTLILSRDRFGEKPLYYTSDESGVWFASEVKALQRALGSRAAPDAEVVRSLAHGLFESHGTTRTYLKGVSILPAGHLLVVKRGNALLKRYYELATRDVPSRFEDQAKGLRDLLFDSVSLRLRTDVPAATCLSGGLDSSAIASVIQKVGRDLPERFRRKAYQGFCATFPGSEIDEAAYATSLAGGIGLPLELVEVKTPGVSDLEAMVESTDGPLNTLAFYSIWSLYRRIRAAGYRVTLDGQGVDEMLGGYNPIDRALDAAVQLRDPIWYLDVLATYGLQGESSQHSARSHAARALVRNLGYRARSLMKRFRPAVERVGHVAPLNDYRPAIGFPSQITNELDRSLFEAFFQNPLPLILQIFDRASMAHGVECRMPFMDYRLVEYVFSLPVRSKVGHGYTKRVLREAMKGLVPDSIRLRRRKIGFNAPLIEWYQGPLREFMHDQISSRDFLESAFFDGAALKARFDRFVTNPRAPWSEAVSFWPAVHTTLWLRGRSASSGALQGTMGK